DCRRLITLISEDRPGPPSWPSFVGSCLALGSRILRRITYSRVLLRRPARPLTRSLRWGVSPLCGSLHGQRLLGFLANGPDEADQLSCEGRDDFGARFALVAERPVAAVKALLSRPGDFGHLRCQLAL